MDRVEEWHAGLGDVEDHHPQRFGGAVVAVLATHTGLRSLSERLRHLDPVQRAEEALRATELLVAEGPAEPARKLRAKERDPAHTTCPQVLFHVVD